MAPFSLKLSRQPLFLAISTVSLTSVDVGYVESTATLQTRAISWAAKLKEVDDYSLLQVQGR